MSQRLALITLLLSCLLVAINGQGSRCSGNADIVFAIDASGSIKDQDPGNWDRLKNFVIEIATNMARSGNRALRFGLVKFSDNATSSTFLRDYSNVDRFSNSVKSADFIGGYTNHADALRKSEAMFSGKKNDRFIIIVTDGMPTVEQGIESGVAKDIRADGTIIIAVGVTSNINNEKLLDLAGQQKYVFQSPDFRDSLSKQVMDIIEATGDCDNFAQDAGSCNGPPEVVLALDTSGSINDADSGNFQRLLEFGISIAKDIVQRRPDARFALVSFSTNAKIESRLNDFRDVNSFAERVRRTQFVGEYTNPADAIRKSRDILRQARTPSARFVIIVTDGTPTQEIGDEISEAEVTRSQGAKIILVGVTSMIDEQNLIKMSGDAKNVFKAPDFRSLPGQISNVVMATDGCPTEKPVVDGRCEATNIIFAVDTSGSIKEKGENNWELMKTFVADLARGLSSFPNTKFGLVQFSSKAEILGHFTDYRNINDFESLILNMPYIGSYTNMADAFRKAREIIVRQSTAYPQVILITDGIPTREQGVELQEAETLKNIGARILTIGVTSDINVQLLEAITGSSRLTFSAPTFQTLSAQVIPVVNTACQQGAPSAPAIGGDAACNANPDIVFVVDASGSITEQDPGNWQRVKELLRKSIQNFFQRFPTVRFGLVLFSTNAKIAFTLTDFSQINQVYDTIDKLEYMGSRTNIAEGIVVARDQVFARASRPNVQRIMIIITDGVSNEREGQEVAEAKRAKDSLGIRVVSVAVTDAVSFDTLRQVVSDPSTGVIGTPNFQTLTNVIGPVISAACLSRDLPRCTKVDIALLVDSSGSIKETGDNWPLVIATLNRIVDVLDKKTNFGPNGAQVAIVLFSTNARIVLPLTGNKQVLLAAIKQLPFLQSRTNIAEALFLTRTNIFNGGDRQDADNVVVLISDGKPNEPRDTTRGASEARKEALKLHSVASTVAVMGVTRFIDEKLLRDEIASKPQLFLKARDFQELETSAAKIVDRICT